MSSDIPWIHFFQYVFMGESSFKRGPAFGCSEPPRKVQLVSMSSLYPNYKCCVGHFEPRQLILSTPQSPSAPPYQRLRDPPTQDEALKLDAKQVEYEIGGVCSQSRCSFQQPLTISTIVDMPS
ncbi:hypothetical protein EUGRSUZ_F04410 [Eucalyptus grandis]|uniref:Uncharacterized protein n=2 Tax=Eucalyptus grandis TaxID=71139 RepID=A0ACC3KQR7_EUCGR|nr:hypothetical protein EUGRSUZ_F04410 [Eucalyptus grandis]